MTQQTFGTLVWIDAETEYRRQMGEEAYERQVRASKLARKACVCEPSSVRRRWPDSGEIQTRKVHAEGCPKRKSWMEKPL